MKSGNVLWSTKTIAIVVNNVRTLVKSQVLLSMYIDIQA